MEQQDVQWKEQLTAMRYKKKMRIIDIAKETGVHENTALKWLNGSGQEPSFLHKREIEEAYNRLFEVKNGN